MSTHNASNLMEAFKILLEKIPKDWLDHPHGPGHEVVWNRLEQAEELADDHAIQAWSQEGEGDITLVMLAAEFTIALVNSSAGRPGIAFVIALRELGLLDGE